MKTYNVVRIDGTYHVDDSESRQVARGILSLEDAVTEMVRLAHEEMVGTPNGPILDQSGPVEVSIWSGQYRCSTYRVQESRQ